MTVLAQEPVPDDLLPFGWVDCGVIDVVGDDTSDDDQDPGSVPVVGDGLIVFIPKITEMRVMRNDRSTLVRNRPVPVNLDQDGVIELAGHRLVKLWHGVWTCTPGNRNILDFDQFDFELTGDYTVSSPLPLWHIAPYDPPEGVTVTTMEVPSGQQPGQTLAWDGSQLAWVTPKVTPSVSTLPANSNATASFTGQWPNLTLALGLPRGADGQPTQYQIIAAGRPDIPATMTTAVQAQVAAAPIGATFSSTDGASVGAWQWQKRPDRWTVVVLDTGICSVTGNAANGWTVSSIGLRRFGNVVEFQFRGLNPAAANSDVFYNIPVGFRSAVSYIGWPVVRPSGWTYGTTNMAFVSTGATMRMLGPGIVGASTVISLDMSNQVSWVTSDPCPTVLPS